MGHMEINFLKPEKLIYVDVEVGNRLFRALLDSGASRSLVKEKVVDSDVQEVDESFMVGLSDSIVKVKGRVNEDIKIFGIEMEMKALVVGNEDIKYEVILGLDFLRKHRISLDIRNRVISLVRIDNSKIIFCLNDDNKLRKTYKEKVPIYCNKDIQLKSNESTEIPIKFEESCYNMGNDKEEELMYYEGHNESIITLNGLIKDNVQDSTVIGISKGNGKGACVKKGQVIGYGYTVEIEEADEDLGLIIDLKKLKDKIKLGQNLNSEEADKVYEMLMEVRESLSDGNHDIGKAKVEPHRIELTRETPIWQKPRNFSEPVNQEIESQCQELLASDILEYSDSNWSSPVVPVRKSDGSLRLCVDYRKVNQITKTEKFPMPNLNRCIYRANRISYFTKLDLVRGY